MLKIFNKYETDMSILDDFDFYEERQKAMQERKARQQQGNLGGGNENKNVNEFIRQMSKSFSEVVRLEDKDTSKSTRVKLEKTAMSSPGVDTTD